MKARVLPKGRSSAAPRKKGVLPPGKDEPKRRKGPPRPYRTVVQALLYDMEWVRRNLQRLLAEWGHVYLAVKDHEVFDADPDRNALIMRLRQKYGKQGFLVVSLDSPWFPGEQESPEYAEYEGAIDEVDME
jgi:hypothetical protein